MLPAFNWICRPAAPGSPLEGTRYVISMSLPLRKPGDPKFGVNASFESPIPNPTYQQALALFFATFGEDWEWAADSWWGCIRLNDHYLINPN